MSSPFSLYVLGYFNSSVCSSVSIGVGSVSGADVVGVSVTIISSD